MNLIDKIKKMVETELEALEKYPYYDSEEEYGFNNGKQCICDEILFLINNYEQGNTK